MIKFGDEYNSRLNEAWEKFIQYEPFDESLVRPEILESWKRSRAHLVDPFQPKTTLLPQDAIDKRILKNKLLIDIARPYMENLFSIVKGSGFYLMLVDTDGYILHLIGDEEIIEHGKQYSRLVVGANRSEPFAGTNAIGVPLVIKKPIQVWGNEHYIKPHKDFACSGAPIFDAAGDLLGCLNMTGRYITVHPHTLGMVISAVDGISKELQLRKAYSEIDKINNQRNKIIETSSSSLLLLNNRNEIVQYNTKTLKMLGIPPQKILGVKITDLIRFDEPGQNPLAMLESETDYKEVDLYYTKAPIIPHKFNLSINFVFDGNNVREGTVIRLNETKKINRLVNRVSGYKSKYTFDSIIGSSGAIKETIRISEKAARTDSNVLILGESGVGKELVAQSIHNASSYASGPFVVINCGALPKGLVESELFGYERGAFTGANKEGNPGKFELADGGTIFLDEIGDMPFDVQVTLLRVLETREIVRIGGKYPKPVDVRVIAATNCDLKNATVEKTFRSDLYYRLNVHTVEVPPLRERGKDICELTDYFVASLCESRGTCMTVSSDVYPLLTRYAWPGNVRELENVVERAIALAEGGVIRAENLPDYIHTPPGSVEPGHPSELPQTNSYNLEHISYNMILSSLEQCGGNLKKAAEMLGISRRTLYRKLDKYGVAYQQYRDAARSSNA